MNLIGKVLVLTAYAFGGKRCGNYTTWWKYKCSDGVTGKRVPILHRVLKDAISEKPVMEKTMKNSHQVQTLRWE